MKSTRMSVNKSRKRERSWKGKKYIFLILLMGIMLWTSACGSRSKAVSVDLKEIEERGYVVMGLDDTFAPMGFRNNAGELVGFDIDLAKEVFSRVGIEVRFQQIEWSMKETELNSGNIDLIWNGYSISDERKEKVDFTKPYLENKQIIVTLADTKIETRADLKGKKVAVQNGSTAYDAVMAYPDLVAEFSGGEPVLFDTNNEAFMDLEAGRTEAVVADEVLSRYYLKGRGEEKFKVAKEDFGDEEYGIGVRKTSKELLKVVDDTLDEMRADGTYDKIYGEWFSQN